MNVRHDLIITSGVSITGGNVSLRCRLVAVSAPGCNEGGQVTVLSAEWYAMVTIPCIKDSFSSSCAGPNEPGEMVMVCGTVSRVV